MMKLIDFFQDHLWFYGCVFLLVAVAVRFILMNGDSDVDHK